ncbi:MAG: ribonuclease P protein component [Planctomycetes bacterium]|nr:ribonuclease P protein component [Planctomycetota bacterium]
MKQLTFKKKQRLVSNEQFKNVLANKISFRNELLTMYIARNDCGYSRLGVSVGKVYDKRAVVRNRLKRLLREAFRQNQEQIPAGFDYLLMISRKFTKLDKGAEPALKKLTFQQINTSFLALVEIAAEKIGNSEKFSV